MNEMNVHLALPGLALLVLLWFQSCLRLKAANQTCLSIRV